VEKAFRENIVLDLQLVEQLDRFVLKLVSGDQ
jgi:hypothetical protein